MSELDEVVKKVLSAEDARTYESLGTDATLHRQVLDAFRGTFRRLNAVAWFGGLALFVAACVLAWKFVGAPDLRSMLLWGAGATLAVAGLTLVKLWFWMELQKNAILREVKRLELQTACLVALLANKR